MKKYWNLKRHWLVLTLPAAIAFSIGAWCFMVGHLYNWEFSSQGVPELLGEYLLSNTAVAVVICVYYGASLLKRKWLSVVSGVLSGSFLVLALFPGIPFIIGTDMLFFYHRKYFWEHLRSLFNVLLAHLSPADKSPEIGFSHFFAGLAALAGIIGAFIALVKVLERLSVEKKKAAEKPFSFQTLWPAGVLTTASILHLCIVLGASHNFDVIFGWAASPFAAVVGAVTALLAVSFYLWAVWKKRKWQWIVSAALSGCLLGIACLINAAYMWRVSNLAGSLQGWFTGATAGSALMALRQFSGALGVGLIQSPWLILLTGLLGMSGFAAVFYRSICRAVPLKAVKKFHSVLRLWPVLILVLGILVCIVYKVTSIERGSAEYFWRHFFGALAYSFLDSSLLLTLAAFFCYAVKRNSRPVYLGLLLPLGVYLALVLAVNLTDFRPIDYWAGGDSYPGAFAWMYIRRLFYGYFSRYTVMEWAGLISICGMFGITLWHVIRRPVLAQKGQEETKGAGL